MPDLYRLHVGPVNAPYYQRHFQQFESAGKATPTWNHGAAFFTLAWLVLRKLWRPAGIYASLLLVTLGLWWWGIHGRVPLAVEVAVCAVGALLLCVMPGFMGNGLYYHHVRKLTLQTLTQATSLSQARVQLAEQAITKERLQLVSSMQALVALGLVLAAFFQWTAHHTPPDGPAAAVSGPPALVIPAVASIAPMELPTFTPEAPLPTPDSVDPVVLQPAASIPEQAAAPASADSTPTAPQTVASATPDPQELSVVALAQSIPAQTGAVAAQPALTVPQLPQNTADAASAPTAKKGAPSKNAVGAMAQPQPPKAVTTHGKASAKYYLNAGVYAQASNVDMAVKKLQAAKLNTIRQTIKSKNGSLIRLRIGPFETRKQAEQAAAQARKLRIETSLIAPS